MNIKFDDVVNRILTYKWPQLEDNYHYSYNIKLSHKVLFEEYLNRSAAFLHQFNKEVKYNYIFSASDIMGCEVEIDVYKICPIISEFKPYQKYVFQWYLEWIYLIESGNKIANKYKDIYDVIIKFFERGGQIYKHHGDIRIGKYLISPGCWDKFEYESKDISDYSLDELDKIN